MNKIPINQIVIVEGKYDKITLENVIDATIISCDGFSIFKNKEQKEALKSMAKDRGVILLTDSDRAGAVIRNHLRTVLQGEEIHTLYIPPIEGKEKRKTTPSKEGLLGVEGMPSEVLIDLFNDFYTRPVRRDISATDLFELGLSGKAGSAERKRSLLRKLNLPMYLSNNALLRELNRKFTKEEFYRFFNE